MGQATQQGVLGGMPSRLYPCTPTKLDTWLSCPRRFRLTYLERRSKGRPWAHNSVGASVHNALRDWWSLPVAERQEAAARRLVHGAWIEEGFRDAEQSAMWRTRAAEMTGAYVAGLDPYDEPVGVERTVSAPVLGLALSGRVDRIDRRVGPRGDELAIVDYKTGRRPLDQDAARSSLALAIYAVAASRTLRLPAYRVELHHLPTGTVAAHEHTPESLERHLQRASSLASEAAAAEQRWNDGLAEQAEAASDGEVEAVQALDAVFPPAPGPSCGWCDLRRHCPEGAAASSELDTWAGLATDGAGG